MADIAAIIADARSKLGSRYVFGAEGPNTFDCSGLMQWAFGRHGVRLPRVAADQAKVGTTVPKGQQRPGDLIFSSWDTSPDVDHVALYIGGGEYIHAPKPGDVVKIGRITDSYMGHVTNIQRVTTGAGAMPPPEDGGGWAPGVPDPGDFAGAIGAAAAALRSMAGGVNQVGDLAQKAMWLALPSTQVRLVSGVLGVGFLVVGLWFLIREVH